MKITNKKNEENLNENNTKGIKIISKKKVAFSKPNKKRGRQYSINLPVEVVEDMGINENDRDIEIFYNTILKEIKIKKL